MKVAQVVVPRPLDRTFSYLLTEEQFSSAVIGSWVQVPFGRGKTHGYIVELKSDQDEVSLGFDPKKLKAITELGSKETAVQSEILELCRFVSDYYRHPLGEVLGAAVPAAQLGLRNKKREARTPTQSHLESEQVSLVLSEQQKGVFAHLVEIATSGDPSEKKAALLEGVTGSGKTEVYIALAQEVLKRNQSVLILVPEIALTSQLRDRFEKALGQSIALWHSAMPDGQRRDLYAGVRSGQVRVVVGARSAIFCPLIDLGLIVVDEEHDSTFKQEDRVRYHARDLALFRARQLGAMIVLGSATPSLEALEWVRDKKIHHLVLDQRYGTAVLPEIELIDLTETERLPEVQSLLTQPLMDQIHETLARGEQVMVFLNRRGFSPLLLCEDCGHCSECKNCSMSMTVHKGDRTLVCHLCGSQEPLWDQCPQCLSRDLKMVGSGTEGLEEDLGKLLPGVVLGRLDRDVITSQTRLDQLLDDFRSKKIQLLLGTQMLAKGHDFPGVTLVVVVLADALFRFPDFRSSERAFQVLTQVAGRSGRGALRGKVLIQTYQPDHPVLEVLMQKRERRAFLEGEREMRRELGYSPFGRLAKIRFEADQSGEARRRAEWARQIAQERVNQNSWENVEILGPSEAWIERVKGVHRWDLAIKSRDVMPLQKIVRAIQSSVLSQEWTCLVDIDPVALS
jgi:primosomal protein N' (replication factor Y)